MSLASVNEERLLIVRAASGDDDAFRQLVLSHRERIFRLAWLTLRDADAAADVTQLAFVRLHGSLRRFRGDAALATWLHRVTINLCRDAARRARRTQRLVALDEARDIAAGPESDPELEAIRRATDHEVQTAVATLPGTLREIIALRFGSGLTHAEIATVLRTPLGTVCTRMQRALALVAATLDRQRRSPDDD